MPQRSQPDVLVIGAGVSGLTTALCAAREGKSVEVFTERDPLRTTSALAGAIWGPYVVDDPRVLSWSWETFQRLRELSADPRSGVTMAQGMEASREDLPPPSWALEMPDFTPVAPADLPPGFAAGWRYSIPLVDMPRYVSYLAEQLAELRVPIRLGPPVRSLDELARPARTLINCTGLAARELVPDGGMFSVQGQLVVVDNPGVDGYFIDYPESDEPTYFMAHEQYVVLGGTIVPHSERLEEDPEATRTIVARCAAVEPALATARIREVRVGLRPSRRGIRVERSDREGLAIIHNYGHGGSGLTVSWGCAAEAAALIDA